MCAAASSPARYAQADRLLDAGQLRQASDICRDILEADPDDGFGHHLMAGLFKATGNFSKALEFSCRAVELLPAQYECYLRMGLILMRLERWSDAEAVFEVAHALNDQQAKPLLYWSDCCACQKHFEKAEWLCMRARDLENGSKASVYEASHLAMQGEVTGAVTILNAFLAGQPNHVDALVLLGKLLLTLGDNASAEARFRAALQINPDSKPAMYALTLMQRRTDATGQG